MKANFVGGSTVVMLVMQGRPGRMTENMGKTLVKTHDVDLRFGNVVVVGGKDARLGTLILVYRAQRHD